MDLDTSQKMLLSYAREVIRTNGEVPENFDALIDAKVVQIQARVDQFGTQVRSNIHEVFEILVNEGEYTSTEIQEYSEEIQTRRKHAESERQSSLLSYAEWLKEYAQSL